MSLPHFLQIGGVALTVLIVLPSQVGVSPEIGNAGVAAGMRKTPLFGEVKRTQIGECNTVIKRTKYASELLIEC
jgi:hypothetical protein